MCFGQENILAFGEESFVRLLQDSSHSDFMPHLSEPRPVGFGWKSHFSAKSEQLRP